MQKLIEIRKIAYFSTWNMRHKVMWPDRPIEYIKLPDDPIGIHFGLFVNERLLAVVSAFVDIDSKEAQFRKFATLEQEQGKGYGTKLLVHAMAELENSVDGLSKIWCNARRDKAPFYERFGLARTEESFARGGKEYIVMEKLIQKH